jgi:hypothetical protein
MAQWNRVENIEMTPHTYGQLTFDKSTKTIQWGKKFFQQIVLQYIDK